MTDQRLAAAPALAGLVDAFQPIGLAELQRTAALLTRVDRKYVVGVDQLVAMAAAVSTPIRVLEIDSARTFEYRSTYFDTPELVSYHQAARRRPRRFKVRTRRYGATGTCWIEAKLRARDGRTVKARVEHDPARASTLTPSARRFLGSFAVVAEHLDALAPSLTTVYRRVTMLCEQRVTLDVDLDFCQPAGRCVARFGRAADAVIVETKSAGRWPGPFDRALWAAGVRPTTISKYGIGVTAAHPELTGNKWHRTIARHVERVDATAPLRCTRPAPRPLAIHPLTLSIGDRS